MSGQLKWRCPACRIVAYLPASAVRISCLCGYEQLGGLTPGLGDHLAAWLHRCGLTRSRYLRAKKLLGLQPVCDCPARQEAINQLGVTMVKAFRRLFGLA